MQDKINKKKEEKEKKVGGGKSKKIKSQNTHLDKDKKGTGGNRRLSRMNTTVLDTANINKNTSSKGGPSNYIFS